jgi:hypothetical protein
MTLVSYFNKEHWLIHLLDLFFVAQKEVFGN